MVAKLAARSSLAAAIEEVASRDPVLGDLVSRVGPIRYRPRDPDGPFAALVRAIVFQQLAGRAAQAISIVARYCWAAVPLLRPGATAASLR